MLEAIRSFFRSSMSPGAEEPRDAESQTDIRLAACALLLELAHADDELSAEERGHIEGAVRRHFGVDAAQVERLLELAEAERKQAVDLWQFTSLIDRFYTLGQKTLLAEIMWGIVYADGELAEREHYLMRKISHLLHIQPGYLAEARQRVRERGETNRPD